MRRFFSALLAFSCIAPLSFAQEALPQSPSVVETAQESTVFHSGWAVLDAAGNLTGRVVTVGNDLVPQPGASVQLLSSSGVAASGTTDENGQFSLPNVAPGVYELQSASANSYAAYGVQILPAQEGASSGLAVYAASVSPVQVEEILRTLAVPMAVQAGPAYGSAPMPKMPLVQSHRVALAAGSINGRLAFTNGYGAPQAHSVRLLQDGKIVGRAQVDSMGYFTVAAPGAGTYDLIVGGIGHGVVGVEVVDDMVRLSSNQQSSRLVAARANNLVQDTLLVPVAMPAAAPQPEQVVYDEFPGAAPLGGGFPANQGFAGGGGFGGGAGGGGLGGGMGGAGGLLGVAGLAVGVAALADNDDGFDGNLATPIQ